MSELESLGVQIVDQDDLETSITKKANEVLLAKDKQLEQKRLEKTMADAEKVHKKIGILERRLADPRTKISHRKQIRQEIDWFTLNELVPLQEDLKEIEGRLAESSKQLEEMETNITKPLDNDRLPDETERDYLVRIGKITAFGNQTAFEEDGGERSHVHLRQPGVGPADLIDDTDFTYKDEEIEAIEEDEIHPTAEMEEKNIDDGDERIYKRRYAAWVARRSAMRAAAGVESESDSPEWTKPHPTIPDSKLDDRFKLPGDIHPSLFDYQKTCVQWLWELYNQKTGGIIGDEMGLGKTIQVISFIAGLHYSGLLEKPVLIVVPATVLNQWVNEFHKWWPALRCVILHSIGSGMGQKIDENKLEQFLQQEEGATGKVFKGVRTQINAQQVVNSVMESGHVLITTYVGLRIYSKHLLTKSWGYCVLDEGHKIRNPNSEISLLCKRVKTANRIILSGTPIQNNLIELWSLFDFVFPGRLGTLPVFEQQFSLPINMGGYANASNLQVQTSYKCATILRDLISPYLLRRLKHDVARDLPKKEEMVLFVKLTHYQQQMYESFLESEDLRAIMKGKRNMLMGVDVLRKICNHPDLVNGNKSSEDYGNSKRSGKMEVTRKLIQLWALHNHKMLIFCQTRQMLDILERFLHRITKIDGNNMETGEPFEYLRMDGTTPIGKRQYLVDRFNTDPKISVFLLTTKVGGLGINLTGADRIIIYDPDWNPSTDMQARERAWRLGQKRDIVIYRLMITGSIEEKIYHRQIFKTFLTNKILKDPKQRRFFKMNDLHDLFSLGDQDDSEQTSNSSRSVIKKQAKTDDDFVKVAKIMGVSRLDSFEEGEHKDDEEQIMEGIFQNPNVHSRVQHDDVLDDKNNDGVEKEVNKIVDQSVKMLNESRKATRRNRVGVPTWTGKFGTAGKSKRGPESPRAPKALSSSTILENIKKKKKPDMVSERPDLLAELVEVLERNGRMSSNKILIALKNRVDVKNTRDILLVKSMLRKICHWNAVDKVWELMDEYVSKQ
ncbi:hypothetical protein CANTEDRAFT_122352 [Yamadazyma tenuis ATCC 10573]|uniref:DNA dependent ATPase n=1 Tax=Candida tenuis (strain ATCC 10573 / BCRC 21748 / CBS 615 / JCM 9827 / NBRC 10315 / NRRL Y-1498 / VKM Y-70) TaxID=590646 RepID=G3B3E3_CANTC|nr:uncharacterized protein CANTEDRAFT_122352 [Yamadazyma tenuis ATCC 10573]EGV64145.1 hypothetical protein CANTEDRAFT_122352 [Yamadazyma tenuis ATCC 10573]